MIWNFVHKNLSKVFSDTVKNPEEKREHHQKITSLKNQLKDEQKYSDEQEELLGKDVDSHFWSPQNLSRNQPHNGPVSKTEQNAHVYYQRRWEEPQHAPVDDAKYQ